MHSYEKCARNSFAIHSYKIIGLKVPWNEHLQKKWVAPPPCLLAASLPPRPGLFTLLFHGNKIMELRHISERAVDASRRECYKFFLFLMSGKVYRGLGGLCLAGTDFGRAARIFPQTNHGDISATRRVVPASCADCPHRFPVLHFSPGKFLPAPGARARGTQSAHRRGSPRRGRAE